jgi:hypothetical protein
MDRMEELRLEGRGNLGIRLEDWRQWRRHLKGAHGFIIAWHGSGWRSAAA